MELEVQDKGRITMPKDLRKRLGLKEKDVLVVEVRGNEIVLRPKHFVTVAQVKGIIKTKVDLEEIETAAGRENEIR